MRVSKTLSFEGFNPYFSVVTAGSFKMNAVIKSVCAEHLDSQAVG